MSLNFKKYFEAEETISELKKVERKLSIDEIIKLNRAIVFAMNYRNIMNRLTDREKKLVIAKYKLDLSVNKTCEVLNIARKTYYKALKNINEVVKNYEFY